MKIPSYYRPWRPLRECRGTALSFFANLGTVDGGGWSTPRPGRLYPGRRGTHCTGSWVGFRTGLDRCGKSRPHRFFLFFVLCASSALLLCRDCPGCAFCPYCTKHTTQTSMPSAGFEPATPASLRRQTLALERSATGIRSPNLPARTESL